MSRLPSNRSGQSFIEYALMIILFAIVLLSILLILGDDLRTFVNDLLRDSFPSQPQTNIMHQLALQRFGWHL